MDLTKDNPALIIIETQADCKSKYGIDYLEKMIKADKIADTLTIHFGADYPLRLEFKKLDKLHLKFVLAPRVETE
jgi:DNA polymerase III sliding clamp (beta) subunit (PCNA family)